MNRSRRLPERHVPDPVQRHRTDSVGRLDQDQVAFRRSGTVASIRCETDGFIAGGRWDAEKRCGITFAIHFGDDDLYAGIGLDQLAQGQCCAFGSHEPLARRDVPDRDVRIGGVRPERADDRGGQVVEDHSMTVTDGERAFIDHEGMAVLEHGQFDDWSTTGVKPARSHPPRAQHFPGMGATAHGVHHVCPIDNHGCFPQAGRRQKGGCTTLRKSSAVQRTDYDGAWKEALRRYFEPFLRLCFPAVHAGIDWSRDAIPLDHELHEVVRDAETGKNRVDKLFQVHRHDGTEDWILVHLEIQSRPDHQLPQRLYRYHILELFRLIDWFVQLPKELEVEFRRQVAASEA
jgi:hypothetical protein